MRRRVIAGLLSGCLLVCTMGAVAAPRLGAGDGGMHPLRTFIQGQIGRLMTLRSDLDVTNEQREAIKKIVQGHKVEIIAVATPIVEKRRALRDATLAKTPDETAIRAAASDLGKAIGDAAVLASKVKGEVAKELTPEQQKKIEQFRLGSDQALDNFVKILAK
jgi:Spy/CpxP family protein refolding chaperone